ncbi:hypothetical protein EJ04DRAFT_104106 [Polyplosphaeria fusca]|uniref:Uncharacterized protein n=1 Tax=Polyplosphaeria fusca TaxID=682080 RepID=A0A9P4R6H8_9PLEO|nr:hypothetical protein EJ04DRAFT_104106 [Polyplosphaeria fusca]
MSSAFQFVPRAVRLKGVQERASNPKKRQAKSKASDRPTKAVKTGDQELDLKQDAVLEQDEPHGPCVASLPTEDEYMVQLVCGMELVFTDYAHVDRGGAQWLGSMYRNVDGEDNFVHLDAILQHPSVSSLKPEADQAFLHTALKLHPSQWIEFSKDESHVRRRPDSFPLCINSVSHVESGRPGHLDANFWDSRTVYVEPHVITWGKLPSKIAYWLQQHGGLDKNLLPIQAVIPIHHTCAFVVLSEPVSHGDVRKNGTLSVGPEDWKVMTKAEHTKRTREYVELLSKEGSGPAGPVVGDSL